MHCPKCGNKLVLKFCENEGLVPYCEVCEKFKFPPFSTAVSMVVVNKTQDKILIAKHTKNNDFLLFAGYIKKGESAEKTLVREIKEETGLNAVKYKYMSSKYHEPRNVLMLNFIVVVSDGEIVFNEDEISEITGADVVCTLIGERPGLITATSMSAYIAYKATVGMPEARRTVLSNIHSAGTVPAEAGAHIAEIIKIMLERKVSGTELKL